MHHIGAYILFILLLLSKFLFLISYTRRILILVLIIGDIFGKQMDYIMYLWERFPSVSQNLESCEFYECSRVVVQYIIY